MTEITRLPCPDTEGCGSSDAYCWNTEKQVGHCKSCDDWFSDQYEPIKKRRDPMAFDNTPHPELVDYEYVASRGISERTMEFFDVRSYKGGNGDVVKQEYLYPSGAKKIRVMPKSFSSEGLRQDELFGMNLWPAGSGRIVTITEGEVDALSVHEMISHRGTNPVVSLPSATPSKRLWENCKPWLDSFEKIVLSVDNDNSGNAIASKIFNMFPNKTYRVPHDKYKDANEFLQDNATKDFFNAWWNARKYTPENILNTPDQFLELFRDSPQHQYVPTGIEALDDKILGLMQGHFTVIKAPTGIGKTEVMRYLEFNMLQKKVPFASWHLEETKLRSLLGLVSYDLGMNVTRRDLISEMGVVDKVEDSIRKITQEELFYQFYMPDGSTTDDFIEQIRYLREGCDCKYIFFEPIQDAVVGNTEAGKEEALADLSIRLSKLAAELNVGIVTIAHTNDNGDPKYCKMIGQRASVIIDLSREKESDDTIERNTTTLRVEKNRPCSEEGYAGSLFFDTQTFVLEETHGR